MSVGLRLRLGRLRWRGAAAPVMAGRRRSCAHHLHTAPTCPRTLLCQRSSPPVQTRFVFMPLCSCRAPVCSCEHRGAGRVPAGATQPGQPLSGEHLPLSPSSLRLRGAASLGGVTCRVGSLDSRPDSRPAAEQHRWLPRPSTGLHEERGGVDRQAVEVVRAGALALWRPRGQGWKDQLPAPRQRWVCHRACCGVASGCLGVV